MYSNLVHPTCAWFTKYNTCFAIVPEFLECRNTIFSFWWNFAYSNFVTNNFYWFSAFYNFAKKEMEHKILKCWQCCLSYFGNSPSTLHMYSFWTSLFLIWCSICLAFFGERPNNKRPLVNRSNRWIVRRFFKLYSFANINTTVLCRYLPHGWTCQKFLISKIYPLHFYFHFENFEYQIKFCSYYSFNFMKGHFLLPRTTTRDYFCKIGDNTSKINSKLHD